MKFPLFYSLFGSILSRLFGRFASLSLPVWARRLIYQGIFVRLGVRPDEAEHDILSYSTLNAFFTRRLKPGLRALASAPVVSPVDGTLASCGALTAGTLIQAKGLPYSVSDLLGMAHTDAFDGGSFVTIYLSPGDCHLIFSPVDGDVVGVRHIPGKLFPVREPYVSGYPYLFTKNERVVIDMMSQGHVLSVVLVGAYNVGSMSVPFDTRIRTNASSRFLSSYTYDTPIPLKKGDHLGTFHLGSTVVLVLPKALALTVTRDEGLKIKIGEMF